MPVATRQVVIVVDGLRPDLIDDTTTPTIARLRREGIEAVTSHAVSPPVTRVNAAAMVTGCRPGATGLVGNELYHPDVRPDRAFRSADGAQLRRLGAIDDGLLHRPSLAAGFAAAGRRVVTVGSGSSGCALLLNPDAEAGHGAMFSLNPATPGMPVGMPTDLDAELLSRFGPPPPKTAAADFTATVAYATAFIHDHVLPRLQPDLLLYWITEPDHSQHTFGLDALASVQARAAADGSVAEILAALDETGSLDTTDLLLLSDHGFSTVTGTVDLEAVLIGAGLKQAVDSPDVVVAQSGCGLVHVRDRDPEHIRRIAGLLQHQPFAGAVFTPPHPPHRRSAPHLPDSDAEVAAPDGRAAGPAPPDAGGWVDGTLSDRLLGYAGHPREPDIVVSLGWSQQAADATVPGGSLALVRSGATAPLAQHGNLTPYDTRSTLIAHGPSFRTAAVSEVPAGNLDVAPTLFHLAGVDPGRPALDGRVLTELLAGTEISEPDHTRIIHLATPTAGGETTAVELATVDGQDYLRRAWRDR